VHFNFVWIPKLRNAQGNQSSFEAVSENVQWDRCAVSPKHEAVYFTYWVRAGQKRVGLCECVIAHWISLIYVLHA
jgi:hypothetical protein